MRGNDSLSRSMYLQVLNYKNQPVEQPNSHLINNTRMRCLTKAIAMCGLGHYVYQGHDLPSEDDIKVAVKQPRVPHAEHLETQKRAMNKAETLDRLIFLGKSATDYFKKWQQPELESEIREHYKKVAETFHKDEKLKPIDGVES